MFVAVWCKGTLGDSSDRAVPCVIVSRLLQYVAVCCIVLQYVLQCVLLSLSVPRRLV